MNLAKIKNHHVNAYTAYRVAAEVMERIGLPVDVQKQAGRHRLKVDGKVVQVFGSRAGEWPVNDALNPLAPDTDAVVLVALDGQEPEYYPMPADWYRQETADRYTSYIALVGVRPQNPDTRNHAVKAEHVEQWLDRWDALTG